MTQLVISDTVFGGTNVMDKGYALKFRVHFRLREIRKAIGSLPAGLSGVCLYCMRHLPERARDVTVFIYKFGPRIFLPRRYLERRNLRPGNIVDLLLIVSCRDILKGRLVIACKDPLIVPGVPGRPCLYPALDFRGGKTTFKMVDPVHNRDKRSCYIAMRW